MYFFPFQVYEKGQNAKHLKREPKLDKPGPGALKYYDSVKVNHPFLNNNLIQSSKIELFAEQSLIFLVSFRGGGGVLKFGFGRDVPQQNLKVDPYKYQFFKKK